MESLLKEIDILKQKLDARRPIPPEAVRNLRDVYRLEWTYHSNAIEGNTLSMLETKMVLEEGLTIGGKTLREHFEAINHAEAIDYVEEIISRQTPLSEKVIKDVHSLILKNIDDKSAGKYRTINVRISGSQHQPVHYLRVPEQIKDLLDWYNKALDKLHPVELAGTLHFRFVYIHPFVDGNGRTTRLLMNFVLMHKGFPPAILKSDSQKRLVYYETLETASVQGDLAPFVKLVAEEVKDSMVKYLSILS